MSVTNENFDNLTAAEFEDRLPELIASGPGELLEDPRFATFFEKNPNCSALIRDLQAIADAARQLLQPEEDAFSAEAPSFGDDKLWDQIQSKLDEPSGILE